MIILCGPSACGKSEIAKYLSHRYGIQKAVTSTTREKRLNETDHVDYHFFDEKTFRSLEEQGAFVETATYNSHRYGCLKSEIAPNKAVILEPEGVGNFLKLNDPSLFIVVLTAEERTRIDRMRYRKDKEADIEKRIATDRSAFSEERLPFHHMKLATDGLTIDEAGDLVYRRYCEHLRSL